MEFDNPHDDHKVFQGNRGRLHSRLSKNQLIVTLAAPHQVNAPPPPSFNQLISKFYIRNAPRRTWNENASKNASKTYTQCRENATSRNQAQINAPSMFRRHDNGKKRERPPDSY